jgi:hypothetical protein
MLYEGINRYRFDNVALEYAQKNYNLFMDDWKLNQHDNEQYHTWGGNGGGDTHYTWGALLCLVGLEQYIDKNPWEGLRFGALSPASSGELRGSTWDGHAYDVAIGPQRTTLSRDGSIRFEANSGVVVRKYQAEASHLSFIIKDDRPVRVSVAEFDSGELNLKVDGKVAGKVSVRQGRANFHLPAGEHTIELTIASGR